MSDAVDALVPYAGAGDSQSLDSAGYSAELEDHESRVTSSGQERQAVRSQTNTLASAMHHDGLSTAGSTTSIETVDDFKASMMYVSM